jgi:8-amino-7-oxononanoate synthase
MAIILLTLFLHIAVLLTNTVVRDYLLNYARSLIYTTSLSYANIIAADCSFDMLTNGTADKVSHIPSLVRESILNAL